MTERIVLAIPARFGASRLPGKPLRLIAGKPLITHVIDRARSLDGVETVVATDDQRIVDVVRAAGADAVLTRSDHATGSDRLAEVADLRAWPADTIVVNLQGDEPLMPLSALHAVIDALQKDPEAAAATLATPIATVSEAFDPACVKVVVDQWQRALYFSRAPIPWARDAWAVGKDLLPSTPMLRHLGLYAYRAATLRRFQTLLQTPLERAESLEQLRLLEHRLPIAVRMAPEPIPPGVDTQEDLERVESAIMLKDLRGRDIHSVLFVCLGNICRSPLAEVYARDVFAARSIAVDVESAGTIGQHAGAAADPGSVSVARIHGIDLAQHRARRVADDDFAKFDLILALDGQNLHDLKRRCPPSSAHKLMRLLDFATGCGHGDVPDPYGGTEGDFGRTFALIRAGVDGLAARLAAR